MEKILSIIVPTYNMEALLPTCLNSLDINDDRLEVLIVNDGSTDGSLKIAKKYSTKSPTVFHVIDKENGNYGSCVNTALEHATGKYIKLLDADDWYDTNELRKMLDTVEHTHADVVYTPFVKEFVNKNAHETVSVKMPTYGEAIQLKDISLSCVEIEKAFCMHALAYNTCFLTEIGYKQTESISYTDMEYVYYPLSKAKTILCLQFGVYHYRLGREGQTVSIESSIKHSNDKRVIVERMIRQEPLPDSLKQKGIIDTLLSQFIASYYWTILVIQRANDADLSILRQFDEELRDRNFAVYVTTDKVRCLGIRYIHLWRRLGHNIFPTKLYRLARKLLVKF